MRTIALLLLLPALAPDGDIVKNPVLAPAVNNPRNSEGDFIALKSGILMFVYTRRDGNTLHVQRVCTDGKFGYTLPAS